MFKITLDERSFFCKNDEDVLAASLRNGQRILRGCCSGGCGVCKIKIVDGEFERGTSSMAVLPNSEREENYSLACKTFARSDLKISLIK